MQPTLCGGGGGCGGGGVKCEIEQYPCLHVHVHKLSSSTVHVAYMI